MQDVADELVICRDNPGTLGLVGNEMTSFVSLVAIVTTSEQLAAGADLLNFVLFPDNVFTLARAASTAFLLVLSAEIYGL